MATTIPELVGTTLTTAARHAPLLLLLQRGQQAVPEWVELANGCLCCSVKGQLVQALEALVGQQTGRFDHVLIETTGAAAARRIPAAPPPPFLSLPS